MIRINLIPVKRKKKAKPLPTFVITLVLTTVLVGCVLVYLFFYFHANLQEAQQRFEDNKLRIADLKNKIKEVENFEKLNKTVEERTKIIEQLRKNQSIPVMMLDEISRNIPKGVWLQSLSASGGTVNIDGFAFTNSEVVAYVDNLKGSKVLSDIYLQESKQVEIEKIPLYQFKLTLRIAT